MRTVISSLMYKSSQLQYKYNMYNKLFVTDLLLLEEFVPLQRWFGGLARSGRLWLRRLARSCLALEAWGRTQVDV